METQPADGGQRDGQGSRRRREIVAAVQRLLGEWGSSDRLTMRAVAKEVGISAPSIYLHFSDKTELVWAALEDRYGELAAQMAAAARADDDADPRSRVRAQAHAYCRFAMSSPGHYRLMFEVHQPAADPSRIGGHPARRISAGLRAGLHACAVDGAGLSLPVEQAAQTLWAGLRGMVSLHHSLHRDESSEGLVLQLADGLVDSLVANLMDMAKSREERDKGAHWLIDYITRLVADKRRTGATDGILAELINKTDGEDAALTEKQLIGLGVLLLFAGHDTTAAMMGLSTLTLLTHHEQREQMLAHPEKIGTTVEELMRYLAIVQFGLGRVAKEDLELAGAQGKKGDLVVVAMNAANRDPRAFQAPTPSTSTARWPATWASATASTPASARTSRRAELRTVRPKLFQRFPNLRLATPLEEVPMDFTGTNYGVRKLMVTRRRPCPARRAGATGEAPARPQQPDQERLEGSARGLASRLSRMSAIIRCRGLTSQIAFGERHKNTAVAPATVNNVHMPLTSQARSFDTAAADYAANRPSYPSELLDAVEELAGFPLRGARVADIGAGTGLATMLLRDRGATVIAVEPGPGMASQFRLSLPDVPLVIGDGDNLPLASVSIDVLTYAQAWHWTDQRRSVPEALRVLRTGGVLALWWNDSDSTVPWIADQDARLRRLFGAEGSPHDPAARFRGLPAELGFVHRHVPWTRSVPLDMHLANLASYSDFLVLGKEATTTFMAEERDVLANVFPNGMVEENYVVSLAVATC